MRGFNSCHFLLFSYNVPSPLVSQRDGKEKKQQQAVTCGKCSNESLPARPFSGNDMPVGTAVFLFIKEGGTFHNKNMLQEASFTCL